MITCPEATRAAPTRRPEPVREKCSAGARPPPRATNYVTPAIASMPRTPIRGRSPGGRGNLVAPALVPRRWQAGRLPELVIRTLRFLPTTCQLWGVGEGNVARGLVPRLGRRIGAANDPQTLPPTRRPHRRRDGFETRPGGGWGTPTPAGYRSGSTTVRNGNR